MNQSPVVTLCLAGTLALLSGPGGLVRAALAEEPRRAEPPPTTPTEPSYGDLGQRFVVFVFGKPSLLSGAVIDDLVGDPWQLSGQTEAKLGSLRPRLRVEILQFVAGNLHAFQLVAQPDARVLPASAAAHAEHGWSTHVAPTAGSSLVRGLITTTLAHFRPEELADLGVYGLSRRLAFFPKSVKGWARWKQLLVRNDLLFGSAVALGLAATDNLQASVSGRLGPLTGGRFRVGWFTDMADLGVSLHPTLRTGLKLKSPDVQVSAGMVENFGVTAAPEIRAAELVVDNHWVPGVKAPAQWELAVAATGRYVFASHVAAKGDAVQTILDLYARRGGLSGVPQLSLLIRAHAATNYRNEFSASTAVGVEHQRYDFALLVRCARTVDRWAGTDGASCGVVMAVAPGVLR